MIATAPYMWKRYSRWGSTSRQLGFFDAMEWAQWSIAFERPSRAACPWKGIERPTRGF